MDNVGYHRVGDYLLPNTKLKNEPSAEPITKYGAMRRSFLREYRSITYNRLLLTERLFPHLREVQRAAQEQLDRLMSDILMFNPPSDKTADSLAWAAHMARVHSVAEKMVLNEVVYT